MTIAWGLASKILFFSLDTDQNDLKMCSTNTLVYFCIFIGVLFSSASVVGICGSIYLIFGDPIRKFARDTYEPSWEDIGPALACSVLSLLANVLLAGGSRQHNRHYLSIWIIWMITLVLIFWSWFGYNYLKHQGYVRGLKGCYFCGLVPEEMTVTFGGILCTVIVGLNVFPVAILKGRFAKEHRQLTRGVTPVTHFTDSRQYLAASPPHHYQELTPFQQQQQQPEKEEAQKQYEVLQEQHQQLLYPQQLQLQQLQQQQLQEQLYHQQLYQQQMMQQGYFPQLTSEQYQQLILQQQQQLQPVQNQQYYIQTGQTVVPFQIT